MPREAIAFDAFGTLFDLGALREALGDEVFDGFAARLVPWTWHATAAQRFRPFPAIAHAAASAAGAGEPDEVVDRLECLPLFHDVREGLETLRDRRLAVLSNGTAEGVRALVEHAGIADRFEHLLAADQVQRYKPSPELYALAPRAFDVEPQDVLLVSSNEWDVAGAAQAGLSTAWLGRGREPTWVLGIEPDMTVRSIAELSGAG